MLYLYDKSWDQIDMMSTAFKDQAEKFVFWRNVANRATYLRAFAFVWTSESWLRDIKGHQDQPINELPIVGEQLHVVGADALEAQKVVAWNIVRSSRDTQAILEPVKAESLNEQPGQIFFIMPVVTAMKSVHGYSAV